MMIFQSILLFLGFFIISCTARGQALSEFCFANPKQASKGIKYANQILIKSEKFIYQPGQSCAQIYLEEESRFELIDLFIRRKFSLKRSSGSLTQAHRSKNASQHCRLVLEEIGHQNDNSNKISIGSKSLVKGYGAEITDRFQTTIVMMSGKSAVVITPDGEIKVTCQITNSGAANVTFSMQSKISSQVLIMPEQTLSVGSFSLQSRDQDKQMSLIGGLKNRKGSKQSTRSYQIQFSSF